MAEKDSDFTAFEIKTCVVQLGLTEEDDKYLEELTQHAVAQKMAALEQRDTENEIEKAESVKENWNGGKEVLPILDLIDLICCCKFTTYFSSCW